MAFAIFFGKCVDALADSASPRATAPRVTHLTTTAYAQFSCSAGFRLGAQAYSSRVGGAPYSGTTVGSGSGSSGLASSTLAGSRHQRTVRTGAARLGLRSSQGIGRASPFIRWRHVPVGGTPRGRKWPTISVPPRDHPLEMLTTVAVEWTVGVYLGPSTIGLIRAAEAVMRMKPAPIVVPSLLTRSSMSLGRFRASGLSAEWSQTSATSDGAVSASCRSSSTDDSGAFFTCCFK